MNQKKKALVALIIGNGIFGFSFLFSKMALNITIPSVLIAIRFTLAFIVLNLIVLFGAKIKKNDGTNLVEFSLKGKPLKNILLLALFQPVTYFIAENYGIVYTSSAFAGIIIAVIPIAGLVMDVVIMRTKVTKVQIGCAIASVIGVIITTVGAKDMKSSAIGLALLLIAVVAAGLFWVFSKKSATDYNALERTYVMFGIGSVTYVILALIQCRGRYDELILTAVKTPIFIISILYLAVISSVVAFLLLNYGSGYVSISQATIFANFTTVISIIAGVFILHEAFSIGQVVGAAIILLSVYFCSIYGE